MPILQRNGPMGFGFTEDFHKRAPARARRGFLYLVSSCVPFKPHLCPERSVLCMSDAVFDQQCGLSVQAVPELGVWC